jgi:hypothetical protein
MAKAKYFEDGIFKSFFIEGSKVKVKVWLYLLVYHVPPTRLFTYACNFPAT